MTRVLRILVVLALPLGLMALPAAAEDTDPCTDPETGELVLEEQEVFIHQAETKIGNLAAADVGSYPSWDENAPEQSVTQGAGGGYAGALLGDYAGLGEEILGLTVEGTFTGCLDSMLVDLYAFLPTNRTGTAGDLVERPFVGYINLYVDGNQVVWRPELETNTQVNPNGSVTYWIRFGITNLHQAITNAGVDPAAEHTVRLNVIPRYLNTNNAIFVYDTTEVPSGILFNGTPTEDYPSTAAF